MPEVLEISDGTVTVSLITATGTTGWHLRGARPGWNPQSPRYKGGGTWQDSPLATGRYLADKKFNNVIDTFLLHLEASTQDGGIADIRELQQLLEKAAEYWATDWQEEPVWIKAQAENETNARYAVIYTGMIPDFNDPYSCRFEGGVAWPNDVWMWNLSLIVEHGLWQKTQPGTGTALEMANVETYNGENLGNVDDTGTREPVTSGVYFANHDKVANITHIFTWSAANGFSANLLGGGVPFNLLDDVGAAPQVGDYVCFGIDTTVADSGPFSSLVFDIGTAQVDLTIVWENVNACGPIVWLALPIIIDNTSSGGLAAGGDAFDTTGVNSVHWKNVAGVWVPCAVNGVTAYWVRARITAVGAAPVVPTQQNRDVYTISWPYVEIQADQFPGDISGLSELRPEIQSANLESASQDLSADRLLVGARSYDRGANFTAYLNFADEQNPAGVTVGTGVGAAFATRTSAPTGRCINYNPGVVQTLGRRAYIDLDNTIAPHYEGTYHAFVRAYQSGGADGDITLQLKLRSGNGAPFIDSAEVSLIAGDDFRTYDMGTFTISPPSTYAYDIVRFDLHGSNSAGAGVQAYIYDLVLIPVDEWAADVYDTSGDNDSALRERRSLDLDSVTFPKDQFLSILRLVTSGYVTSTWTMVTPSEVALQSGERQRLWFLQIEQDGFTGGGEESRPEIASSLTSQFVARYLTMRGAT